MNWRNNRYLPSPCRGWVAIALLLLTLSVGAGCSQHQRPTVPEIAPPENPGDKCADWSAAGHERPCPDGMTCSNPRYMYRKLVEAAHCQLNSGRCSIIPIVSPTRRASETRWPSATARPRRGWSIARGRTRRRGGPTNQRRVTSRRRRTAPDRSACLAARWRCRRCARRRRASPRENRARLCRSSESRAWVPRDR